jgi:hypothetical protein
MGDVGLDFGDTHFFGMAFVVVEDVAAAPFDVGLFGAVGVMFGADGVAELFEEFFLFWRGGGRFWHFDSLLKAVGGCYTGDAGRFYQPLQSNS